MTEHYNLGHEEQAALSRHFERLARRLASAGTDAEQVEDTPLDEGAEPMRLRHVVEAFGLTKFERDVLLLVCGVEMSSALSAACAERNRGRATVDFALCFDVLESPYWDCTTLVRPLRRWRLIEVLDESSVLRSPLRVPERVMQFIAGVDYLDPQLSSLLSTAGAGGPLSASQEKQAQTLAARFASGEAAARCLQLVGNDAAARIECAYQICESQSSGLILLDDSRLAAFGGDLDSLARLLEREALLSASFIGLCVPSDRPSAVGAWLIESMRGPTFVLADEAIPLRRPHVTATIARPEVRERVALWRSALGDTAERLNGTVELLATQFRLTSQEVAERGADLERRLSAGETVEAATRAACRGDTRSRLDTLAERIDARSKWEDLVLPDAQRDILMQVCAQVRARHTVYGQWGFGNRMARGQGVSVLFCGESGTGKTLAAEVLASELGLDLYRIDLSSVVSKYIGETEKNLKLVFEAGESGGSVLLFDEADALFGKRSEIKDSHDRYANIEVSYLLQRMESYSGLAILTTNQRSTLDQAFERRLRFIVNFPFPSSAQREGIWRRMFPSETPLGAIDYEQLSQLNVTGGLIRNIAVNAAFLAADEGAELGMAHLARAARAEMAKTDRPAGEAQIRRWA